MGGTAMRVTGLAVAVVVVLSACTGGEHNPGTAGPATSGPSRSSAVSASPSPSVSLPTRPERPAAMQREDANGAAAAAEYFIELYPYVMATGDTKEFEAMSHPECGFCDQALTDVNRIQNSNQRFQGGEIEAELLDQFLQDDLTGIYPIDFEVRQQESRTLDADDTVISTAGAQISEHRVEVGRETGHWIVIAIAPRPEP